MIIFDRIISSIQRTGGASVLFNEISARLLRDAVPYVEYGHSQNDLQRPNFNFIRPRALERYRKFCLPPEDSRSGGVFHSTCYRLPQRRGFEIITTVHDFTYERIIKGLPAVIHSLQKNAAILASDVIICVSENTRDDLLRLVPKVDPRKIEVVYNGASDGFHPISGLDHEAYVLYVGQRVGYKNFRAVIEAVGELDEIELVCVGGGAFTEQERVLLNSKIKNRFRHLGYLTESELNIAYNKALCLVYPSLYEGFGIPIIESMKAGCPVIAVNNSSIPEVAGDAGLLIDRGGPQQIADAIMQLIHTSVRAQCVSRGLRWSSNFSWERNYFEMLRLYKKLMRS